MFVTNYLWLQPETCLIDGLLKANESNENVKVIASRVQQQQQQRLPIDGYANSAQR